MTKEEFIEKTKDADPKDLLITSTATLMTAIVVVVDEWKNNRKTAVECMEKLSELADIIKSFKDGEL